MNLLKEKMKEITMNNYITDDFGNEYDLADYQAYMDNQPCDDEMPINDYENIRGE